jgi:hypothetical protein
VLDIACGRTALGRQARGQYDAARERRFMADMGEEFVNLNSQLVTMRPDDIRRGLEGTIEALPTIRRECPFVGYDMIVGSASSP